MSRAAAWIDRGTNGNSPYRGASTVMGLPLLLAVPLLVLLLIVRRASGALVHPLPPAGLMVCGLFLGTWAVAAHEWLARYGTSWQSRAARRNWQWPGVWLPPAVLLPACYALLLPGSSVVGTSGLIALLAIAEVAAWGLRRRGTWPAQRPATTLPGAGAPAAESLTDARTGGAASRSDEPAENVIAEMIRRRDPDGREAIRGWVQAELAAGQRSAPVHVAFCPALAGRPSCEAEQVAGPPATIRVAQVLPYGARFDVKLDAPASSPATVRIEFAATASADGEDSD